MLPNLDGLRLDQTARTGAGTPDPYKGTGKRAKIGKLTVLPSPPARADIEARYELGTRVELPGTLEVLRAIGSWIEATEPESEWFFSSNGANAQVAALRVGVLTALGDASDNVDTRDALLALDNRFANKPAGNKPRQGCGTYNCFESSVDLKGAETWQVSLRALLVALNRGSSGEKFALPATVAVRAPKMRTGSSTWAVRTASGLGWVASDWDADGTREERDELMLTLYTAHIGIAPPVLAAFPVEVVHENGSAVMNSYAYVTEDGWQDFGTAMKQLHIDTRRGRDTTRHWSSIEDEAIRLLRLVADHRLALFDIKPGNMVLRQVLASRPTYELRMIDFGASFMAQVNMHAERDDERASSDCVFFINGLLFLNAVLRLGLAKSEYPSIHMFKRLADEVVDAWQTIGRGNDFCGLLSKDLRLRDEWRSMENLQRVSKQAYNDALHSAFYMLLNNYTTMDATEGADARGPANASYLGRLAESIQEIANQQTDKPTIQVV